MTRLEDFYTSGEYFEQNPTWDVEDSPYKAKQVLLAIERNQLTPASVCEVGCGAGEILNQLHAQLPDNVSFAGFEISPHAHKISKQSAKDRLQFYLKDIAEEPDGSFDLVLVLDVFEHVEDYFGFLRTVRRKGTYKLFHIPLDLAVVRVLFGKPILRRRHKYGHIHYFTKETALATLDDTGYEIIDHFYTAGGLELPAKSAVGKFAKLPLWLATKIHEDLAVRILGGHSLMVLAK